MATDPPRDLTAERAAALAQEIYENLTLHSGDELDHNYLRDRADITQALLKYRQDALREAASTVQYMIDSGLYEPCAGVLGDVMNALDRLASEGG